MSGRSVVRYIFLLLLAAAVAAAFWFASRPPPLIVQGEVTADRVDVSTRVTGRVVALNADVGDNVETGKVLIQLGESAAGRESGGGRGGAGSSQSLISSVSIVRGPKSSLRARRKWNVPMPISRSIRKSMTV